MKLKLLIRATQRIGGPFFFLNSIKSWEHLVHYHALSEYSKSEWGIFVTEAGNSEALEE